LDSNCRQWHSRRVLYTDEAIIFTQPGTSKIMDAIPLFEVEDVIIMNGDKSRSDSMKAENSKNKGAVDKNDEPVVEKKCGDTNKVKFLNSLQIHTTENGYNSGRQYIVQAKSSTQIHTLAEELKKLSKLATERHLAKSRFVKAQVQLLM
jgi:hypothetical protein